MNGDVEKLILSRHTELFGVIAASNAQIKFVNKNRNLLVIRCSLSSVKLVLVTIALLKLPILVLSISGTLRSLKKRTSRLEQSFSGVSGFS